MMFAYIIFKVCSDQYIHFSTITKRMHACKMYMLSYGLISVVFVEESWCEDNLEGYVAINASEGHLEKSCNQRRKGARKIKREKAALFPSSSTCCDYWLLVTQDTT